jgi:hypothetical protein
VLRTLSIATLLAASLTLVGAPAASTQPAYVDHVVWAKWGDLSSLRVYPTAAAREASKLAGTVAQADQAWSEVLAAAPDADIPGMREQFVCHWQYAELAQPGKTSWNLEPWRPEVDATTMLATGCNPGGTEEPF